MNLDSLAEIRNHTEICLQTESCTVTYQKEIRFYLACVRLPSTKPCWLQSPAKADIRRFLMSSCLMQCLLNDRKRSVWSVIPRTREERHQQGQVLWRFLILPFSLLPSFRQSKSSSHLYCGLVVVGVAVSRSNMVRVLWEYNKSWLSWKMAPVKFSRAWISIEYCLWR